mmetsp:Transcript_56007/g.130452  ORF Transcript_56007/g.130452 Transcript_56007/m.130452 type:complete len:300 (+) Transcript_56007:617-1516(+)
MQPRSLVERWPILHSALSHSIPSTRVGVTCTPSSTPSSKTAAAVGEVSEPAMRGRSPSTFCCSHSSSLSFGESAPATGKVIGVTEAINSEDCAKLTRLPGLSLQPSETISRPGGGRIDAGEDDGVGELVGETALFFLLCFGVASVESTWSASKRGNDLAFPGKPASSTCSSRIVFSGMSLRRSSLCSNLSFDMSSRVFFFQSSSSKILFCSDAICVQRYCTHCAKEAACLAATSAWKAAQVALAAWMLFKSWVTSPSPGVAGGHQLCSLGEPSLASACGFSNASSICAWGADAVLAPQL